MAKSRTSRAVFTARGSLRAREGLYSVLADFGRRIADAFCALRFVTFPFVDESEAGCGCGGGSV